MNFAGLLIHEQRRDALIARLPSETIQAVDAQLASWQAASADEAANNPRVAASARAGAHSQIRGR